jgi:hypothetical protein
MPAPPKAPPTRPPARPPPAQLELTTTAATAPRLQGFIRPASRAILIDAATPAELLDKLAAYQPPPSLIALASAGKLAVHERG